VKAVTQNPKVAVALALAAGALLLAAGWFLLVSPAKSEASDLDAKITSTQDEIAARRAALASKPKIEVDLRPSDLFRLTRAVPGRTDMTGVLLELSRTAKQAGVTFTSIQPSERVVGQGYDVLPLNVVVEGRFGEVNSFLNRVRRLVTVRKRHLDASGRLFAVDKITLGEAQKLKFPSVQATLTLDTFVYTGRALPVAPNDSSPSTTTDSSTPSGGGAVAAGATG
jgi:Tfp pilus assembly protein PilO